MGIRSHLNSEERAEFDSALHDALAPSGNVNTRSVERFLHFLRDAEQAHRPWVQPVLKFAQDIGLNAILRAELKSVAIAESVGLFAYDGRLVATPLRRGRRRAQVRGEVRQEWEQALFEDFSWAEVIDWLQMINTQIGALLINRAVGERILELREMFPDTYGPQEACTRIGTTLADYLASPPEAEAA